MRLFKRRQEDNLTIEEKFLKISEDAKTSGIKLKKAIAERNELSELLGITKSQVVVLSFFVEAWKSEKGYYSTKTIRDFLNINNLQELEEEILELKKAWYLNKNGREISKKTFEILKEDRVPESENLEGLDGLRLVIKISDYFDVLKGSDYYMTPEICYSKIMEVLEKNPESKFYQGFKELSLGNSVENQLVVLRIACGLVVDRVQAVNIKEFDIFFTDPKVLKDYRIHLRYNDHPLFYLGVIEEYGSDFAGRETYTLSRKAKDKLLSDIKLKEGKHNSSYLQQPESIEGKEMFYESKILEKVGELKEFFSPEKYKGIRDRLKKSGYKTGFTCLFYGKPGTGKTETVYQIAKASGREIFQVDMSQVRSKWVGDSEKILKGYFEKYKEFLDRPGDNLEPILLFNEADAIIGNRLENVEDSVDKMENALQNILLQEMEDFDGILIATTNLQGNLDKAFDRRFLYKLEFPNPSQETKAKIWMSKIHDLSGEEALELSRYDLSGGQIDNISRKYLINQILHGTSGVNIETLKELCQEEKLDQKRRVGFF